MENEYVFDREALQKRLDQLRNRKHFKIPHLYECIAEYMKTEKGKEAVIEYINSVDGWNYELIDEILDYANRKR